MIDVRAAAERLRRQVRTHDAYRAGDAGKEDEWRDLWTLYHAEHPADDATLVDDAFLVSLGFKGGSIDFGPGELNIYTKHDGGCHGASIEIENNAAWYGCRHEIDLPIPQTRRDVRRLLTDLVIGIKENAANG